MKEFRVKIWFFMFLLTWSHALYTRRKRFGYAGNTRNYVWNRPYMQIDIYPPNLHFNAGGKSNFGLVSQNAHPPLFHNGGNIVLNQNSQQNLHQFNGNQQHKPPVNLFHTLDLANQSWKKGIANHIEQNVGIKNDGDDVLVWPLSDLLSKLFNFFQKYYEAPLKPNQDEDKNPHKIENYDKPVGDKELPNVETVASSCCGGKTIFRGGVTGYVGRSPLNSLKENDSGTKAVTDSNNGYSGSTEGLTSYDMDSYTQSYNEENELGYNTATKTEGVVTTSTYSSATYGDDIQELDNGYKQYTTEKINYKEYKTTGEYENGPGSTTVYSETFSEYSDVNAGNKYK